ncbi:MAG TPA: SET domain-containing protein [Candidatus Paceibacterota bacterium]|nr:SET domain-containing protein [Candidatus Paceibacterota bacterium]
MQKRKKKFEPGNFNLLVKRSTSGLGLFAGEPIKKGSCIIEYKGRTITEAEAYTSRSKYLFEINSKKTIDGRPKWNKAGYINHSCVPNAEPEIRTARVFIMAKKNIKEGEEITYDYGDEYFNDYLAPGGCRCPKHRGKKTAKR